jgi:hypothetical protein
MIVLAAQQNKLSEWYKPKKNSRVMFDMIIRFLT